MNEPKETTAGTVISKQCISCGRAPASLANNFCTRCGKPLTVVKEEAAADTTADEMELLHHKIIEGEITINRARELHGLEPLEDTNAGMHLTALSPLGQIRGAMKLVAGACKDNDPTGLDPFGFAFKVLLEICKTDDHDLVEVKRIISSNLLEWRMSVGFEKLL